MLSPNISLENKTVLITGAAGFIGSYLALELLGRFPTIKIVGVDSITDYYDVTLKEERLRKLDGFQNFTFVRGNIADKKLVSGIFLEHRPNVVVNLAAQAGVRYSITNPDAYVESNLVGFYNILEACRHAAPEVEHLVYASSSSVYGSNGKVPYSTDDIRSCRKTGHGLFRLYGQAARGKDNPDFQLRQLPAGFHLYQ